MTATTERRSPELLRRLAAQLAENAAEATGDTAGGLTFMEVCGTHTMAIARFGLRDLLPAGLRLVSGPGCPVCVTAMGDLDTVLALARRPEVTLATFGDLRPCAGVALVACRRACRRRRRARRVLAARRRRDGGGGARSGGRLRRHRLRDDGPDGRRRPPRGAGARPRQLQRPQPAQDHARCRSKALLELGETDIAGFILPGHVSVVTGTGCYEFLARDYGVSGVVAGFEAADVLEALLMLVRGRAPGDRHPVRARGAARGQRGGAAAHGARLRAVRRRLARARGDRGLRAAAARGVRGVRCRAAVHDRRRTSHWNRRAAAAARCCAA